MNLGSLYVNLNADSKQLVSGFESAAVAVEKFSRQAKKVANELAGVAMAMVAMGGASLALAATVDQRTAKGMDRLKQSTQLLAIQVSDVLMPAVNKLGQMFRSAADWVAGLDPAMKKQIATWAIFAIQTGVALKIFAESAALLHGVFKAFTLAVGVIGAIGVGPIMAIVAAIAIVAAGVAALHYAFRTNLGGIADMWKKLTDWISSTWNAVFSGVGSTLTSALGAVMDVIVGKVQQVAKLMEFYNQATGDKSGALQWKEVGAGAQLALNIGGKNLIKPLFKSVVSDALDLGKAAGAGFVDEWKKILKDMGLPDFQSILDKKGHARGISQGKVYGDLERQTYASNLYNEELNKERAKQVDVRGMMADQPAIQKGWDEFYRGLDAQRKKELQARSELAAALAYEAKKAQAQSTGSHAGLTAHQAVEWGVSTRKQDEQDRRANLTPKQKGEEDSAAAAKKWSAVGSIALAGITSAMGEVGNLVQSAAQAVQQGGGVWGAVIAVILEVVKKTESAMHFVGTAVEFVKELAAQLEPIVKPIFAIITKLLGRILLAVKPIFEVLSVVGDIFAQMMDNLGPVFTAIGDLIKAVVPIIKVLLSIIAEIDKALKPLLDLLAGIFKVIATVLLGILIAANEIAAAFGDAKARAESAKLKALVADMWDPNHDAKVKAEADAAAAAMDAAGAMNATADAANRVAEALTNVPAGYKLALATMGATGKGGNDFANSTGIFTPDAPAKTPPSGASGAGGSTTAGSTDYSDPGEVAYYQAYSDAIAAGATYADAVAAGDAARAAAKSGGGSQKKSGGNSQKASPAGGGAAGASGDGLTIMGNVIIYGTDAQTLADLMADAKKQAKKQQAQKTGNPTLPPNT